MKKTRVLLTSFPHDTIMLFIMDITLSDVSWELSFHHHHVEGIPMVEPRIVVTLDTLFDATSADICLDITHAAKIGNFEPTTKTALFNFHGNAEDDVHIGGNYVEDSIFSMVYENGKIPTNCKVMFWVYATHMNTDGFPSQICVGVGMLNLYDVWTQLTVRRRRIITRVEIKNRIETYGYVTVSIDKNAIRLGDNISWNTRVVEPTVADEVSVAREHAYAERRWIRGFEKSWRNSDNMVDLYGFLIGGHSLPISYFLMRKRNDLGEKEWSMLLYFVLRRYEIEKSPATMKSVLAGFGDGTLPFDQKCSILADMVTFLVTSQSYMTDYVIMRSGDYRLLETFQTAARGGSGDCEDFARYLLNLWETLCHRDLLIQDSVLSELQSIARMCIPVVALDRTTVSKMGGALGSLREIIVRFRKKAQRFRTKMQKRSFDCQGRRGDVSAHMNMFVIPRNFFFAQLRVDLNRDISAKNRRLLMNAIQKDRETFDEMVASYKREKNVRDIPLKTFVLEGTGNFNAVGEMDPHPGEKNRLTSTYRCIGVGKKKIYHPLYDPEQFYLNTLVFITPYFIRHYKLPYTTFVCSYEEGDNLVYGTTYVDIMEMNTDVLFIPMKMLTEREVRVAFSSARRNYRAPFDALCETCHISGLIDVEKKSQSGVGEMFRNFAVEEKRSVYGTPSSSIRDEIAFYGVALSNCIKIARSMSSIPRKIQSHGVAAAAGEHIPILLSFSHQYFGSSKFSQDLFAEFKDAQARGFVKDITVYPEIFGETIRNIVVIITVYKNS